MDAELVDADGGDSGFVVAVSCVIGAITLFFLLCFKRFSSESPSNDGDAGHVSAEASGDGHPKTKKQQKSYTRVAKKSSFNFTHELLHTTLKGHGGNVLAVHFSINGKYLATASDDRTIRLWSVKDFGHGNKCIRANVDLDHAKCIQFSPDSRALVVGLSHGNTVRVFKLGKKEDGTAMCVPLELDFPENHKQELMNIGIGATASGGSFVMTAYKDTTIIIQDIKGEVLNTINTNLGTNNYACVSPCGRYVAACGWTPDVKVWEVKFTRTGEYKDVQRAFELMGHKTSVWSFAFNNDSTRMITASKNGMWRYFDTDIEYEKGQEPCLLKSGKIDLFDIPPNEHFRLCSLSFDGKVASIASLNSFCVFSTGTGEIGEKFKEVHSEIITALSFDISGRYLVSAGDKHIRVFHNLLGYKENIRDLEEKIQKLPLASATRERLEKQRETLRVTLDKVVSAQ